LGAIGIHAKGIAPKGRSRGAPVMETIAHLDALRARIAQWKRDGLRVGLVPTMGNLHAGHHSLLRLARAHADRVVASVFVNPTQFGPGEDFTRYPRTPAEDAAGLREAGCDLLWMPDVAIMYPLGIEAAVRIRVPGATDVLEGAHRPGHFDGVATVVARLFNQVLPDAAAFGRKDYQQLAVIRHMVADLAFPLELLAGGTVREPDGLAMSSRNQYLSPRERATAPDLHATLQAMGKAWRAGVPRLRIEGDAAARLAGAGFQVDYAALRRPDLSEPEDGEPGPRVALVAARLGRTRLIDNLEFVPE
jgi:pantoate--beta-alanine ligase